MSAAECGFPHCDQPAEPNGMCTRHARVTVTGSYLGEGANHGKEPDE